MQGVKFGTTHLDSEDEIKVRSQVRELGAEFQYTLDSYTDFLVVGKRFGDKYNFAICRPSITLLSSNALYEVYNAFKINSEVDIISELRARALKPLEGIKIAVSNMTHEEKDGFSSVIHAAGGDYSEAMTIRCAVLICTVQEGRKYNGAIKWKIPVVHPKWLSDSVKFGHALDPKRYELGKASAIMEPPVKVDVKAPTLKRKVNGLVPAGRKVSKTFKAPEISSSSSKEEKLTFKDLSFAFVGYDNRQLYVLRRTINSLNATESENEDSADYIVVNSARIPTATSRVKGTITEWAIERSLYLKRNCLDDVWGRPVYIRPCQGFQGLRICISGFQGIEERHITLLIKLLGGTFAETMTSDREVLVAESSDSNKVKFAERWKVPVVNYMWLWSCAMEGETLPLRDFALDGVKLCFSGVPNQNAPEVRYEDDDVEKQNALLAELGESD